MMDYYEEFQRTLDEIREENIQIIIFGDRKSRIVNDSNKGGDAWEDKVRKWLTKIKLECSDQWYID